MFTFLARRFTRRALTKPNLAYYLWRFADNGVRTFRSLATLRRIDQSRDIAAELAAQGIIVGESHTFLTDAGSRALAEASSSILKASTSEEVVGILTGKAPRSGVQKEFRIDLFSPGDGLGADNPLLKVALDRKLLEIASSYLGLWPVLHSVSAWLNVPTEAPPEYSQLWHRDPEDLKLLKVFIYLADVDEQCGPFTYIPRTHPFGADVEKAQAYDKKKRLPDDSVSQIFPPSEWRVCTGPVQTMILADTIGYHRGGKPTVGRRILITFTYTSGTPFVDRPLWIEGRPTWPLSAIQRAAVKPLPGVPPPAKVPAKKKSKPGKAKRHQ